MADGLTAEERAAIDRFVAKRRITKVPQGATSQPMPRFDQSTGKWYSVCGLTGDRLTTDEAKQRWNRQAKGASAARMAEIRARRRTAPRGPSEAVMARRDKIAELAGKMTAAQIAETLDVSASVVFNDLSALDLSARREPRGKAADAKVAAARAPGRSMAEIARRTGFSEKTVAAAFERNGWEKPSRSMPAAAKAARQSAREAEQAEIDRRIDAVRAGAPSLREIGRRCGLSGTAVAAAFRRNGWTPPADGRKNPKKRVLTPGKLRARPDGPPRDDMRSPHSLTPGVEAVNSTLPSGVNAVGDRTREGSAAKGGTGAPGSGRDPQGEGQKQRQTRDKALQRKLAAREKSLAKVRDRRRFKVTAVPTGEAKIVAPQGARGTLFPSRVQQPGLDPVLKDGAHSSKIGGDVLVGWLKGARILTLTLEERATCPTSCQMWRTCYGNGMHHAVRWQLGSGLIDAIRRDLDRECALHDRVLVRLHVLGDFFAVEYVAFWAAMLKQFPNLHVFGFTAWHSGTEIGDAIARVRSWHGTRFSVRHSGMRGRWGSWVVEEPVEGKRLDDAVICPEQRDAMNGVGVDPGDKRKARHCGDCGVCWSSDRAVVFVQH